MRVLLEYYFQSNTLTPSGKDKIAKCSDQTQEVKTERTDTPSVIKKPVQCDDSAMEVDNDSDTALIPLVKQEVVKCGVCKQEMDDSLWDDHVQKAHNYLAWKEGESSLVRLFSLYLIENKPHKYLLLTFSWTFSSNCFRTKKRSS